MGAIFFFAIFMLMLAIAPFIMGAIMYIVYRMSGGKWTCKRWWRWWVKTF